MSPVAQASTSSTTQIRRNMPIRFYECGICDHLHSWTFNGDCRQDETRFAADEVPITAQIFTWEDRQAADSKAAQ
jgi:hypothetical protein